MKKAILSLVFLAISSSFIFAQEITDTGKQYTVKSNNLTMTINENGGRISSFKLGGQEVLSQTPEPNSWGSTFWTSPQAQWGWPPVAEFDSMPYNVIERDGSIIMISRTSEKLGLKVVKEFYADEKDDCIVVNYMIFNETNEDKQVAPWEISRVPSKGLILIDAPLDKITKAQGELLPFTSKYGLSWYKFDVTEQNRKINADGQGWLAYTYDGLLLLKKFENLKEGMPAPREAEIQVYVNKGSTYTELESQGEFAVLKPGERLEWAVRWYLKPNKLGEEPAEALAKYALKFVK